MAEKIHTHMLPSGNVIDRSIFVTLSADKMAEVIAKVAGNGLLVVDDASAFFTTDNLIALIAKKDPKSALVNEKVNAFTNDQLKMLLGVQNAQPAAAPAAMIIDDAGVVVGKANAGGYKFAPVPANWSVGTNMSLGPNKIKRKVNSINGDGTTFYITTKSYEKLCKAAINYWAGIDNKDSIVIQCGVQNGGAVNRTATFAADYVACGLHKLRRYELEQVAKYRGWFPLGVLQQAA